MNRDEAKLLLSTCRPDDRDAGDARLAEALALAAADPELRDWFEAEQAADKAIAQKLKAAPLPPDLLNRVRAGIHHRGARRPRRPMFALAIAASLLLLGSLAALWRSGGPSAPPGSFAAFRADMGRFLTEFPRLDLTTDRWADVTRWLADRAAITRVGLPEMLNRFPTIGCREVEWQGKKVALVCFMVEGQVVHLFVIPRGTFPDAATTPEPALARAGPQQTASWTDAHNTYLAITQADEAFLRRLL